MSDFVSFFRPRRLKRQDSLPISDNKYGRPDTGHFWKCNGGFHG